MSAIFPRLLLVVVAGLGLSACSTFNNSSRSMLSAVTPYKVDVVQGNFVSKEQIAALQKGMPRQQVREILGTSLLSDVFHSDRWDYVFTIKRQGVESQSRHLAVFFKGDALDHFEGDEMPSEEEFVATLDTRKRSFFGKVPKLELSAEELAQTEVKDAKVAPEPAALPPLPASYPPLESATR
jgi:outer membrane protein assembly factor BamE